MNPAAPQRGARETDRATRRAVAALALAALWPFAPALAAEPAPANTAVQAPLATTGTAAPVAAPPAGKAAVAPKTSAAGSRPTRPTGANASGPIGGPSWSDLTPEQKTILAPLEPEWSRMGEIGRRKWIKITKTYSRLKPEEQQKLRERMVEWARMTPAQRQLARETYQTTRNLPQQARSEAWQRYQSLPEERKKQLAEADKALTKPTLVTAPPSRDPELAKSANNIAAVARHRKAANGNHPTSARKPAVGAPAPATDTKLGAATAVPPAAPPAGVLAPAVPPAVAPAVTPATTPAATGVTVTVPAR